MSISTTTIYHVGAARDALHVHLRPATIVIAHGRIAQVSRPEQLVEHDFPDARHIHAPDVLVLPRMVNAHAHLDMTASGPQPYNGQFDQWLNDVLTRAPGPAAAAASVAQGWQMSRDAGVGVLGDIARHPQSASALASAARTITADHGQPVVSFLEYFAHDHMTPAKLEEIDAQVEALRAMEMESPIRAGLQPHAPYSAGLKLYQHAAMLAHTHQGLLLSTHLAETREEEQFIRSADGMYADMLRKLGKWDDAAIQPRGVSPIEHLSKILHDAHWLVAHCNYVSDDDIAILASSGTSVAYCPIASHYFGHRNHRWRDMLTAGVNVCLGTDSILCQPPDEKQPLGMMAQMRHLFRHDHASPDVLLAMATTRGCKALDADEALVTLQPDSPADVMAVRFDPSSVADPFEQVLVTDAPLIPLSNIKG